MNTTMTSFWPLFQMTSSISRLSRQSNASSLIFYATATVTATAASLFFVSKTSLEKVDSPNKNKDDFKMDVNFMDKIASKPYLPSSSKDGRSVPRRLRLLVIDVPELTRNHGQYIDGECRVNHRLVFCDGIAPPKHVRNGLDIQQKSLAHALVKCRTYDTKRIGLEVMETSVAHLNPYNLRKTHQFGNLLSYDPGKYSSNNKSEEATEEEMDAEVEHVTNEESGDTVTVAAAKETTKQPKLRKSNTVLATVDDEEDAPWNQYAWIQELQLRVGGKVAFGEPMQPSSKLSRILFGSVYKQTIPSCRRPWEYLLLPIFHSNPAGRDTPGAKNWASNKPHAVIADGAAMQRVAGSLRFLQRVCKDNDVPLYIIHDPRAWGGNTHQALPEALRDLRKTVKLSIIEQAMQGGNSFRRGRMLGQAETEAKWQAKEAGRKTRQVIRETSQKLQKEKENDWSGLNKEELESKLVQHKVMSVPTDKNGQSTLLPEYTEGMVDVARECVVNEEVRQKQPEDEANTDKELEQPPSDEKPAMIASP